MLCCGTRFSSGPHDLKPTIYNSNRDVPVDVVLDGLRSGNTANLVVLKPPSADSSNIIDNDLGRTNVTVLTASGFRAIIFSFTPPNSSVALLVAIELCDHYSKANMF